eukprot:5965644-Amphidinium_carterae.1
MPLSLSDTVSHTLGSSTRCPLVSLTSESQVDEGRSCPLPVRADPLCVRVRPSGDPSPAYKSKHFCD